MFDAELVYLQTELRARTNRLALKTLNGLFV